MEVAIRAISNLATMLDEDMSSTLDSELMAKMPDNVVQLVKRVNEG